MKKIISVALILTMAFTLCLAGCGKNEEEILPEGTSSATTDDETQNENKSYGAWFMATEVDEFGDVVEDSENIIMKSIVSGDFSNTATSKSDLRVEIVETLQDNHIFYFKLLEYNKTAATYLSSSDLILKVKIGDQITEYTLAGAAPNSPVFLGINNTDGNEIFDALYYGNDVRCIITIDSSTYNFTISANGFQDICAEAQKRLEEIKEKNRIKDTESLVNNLLSEEDGSEKLKEAYQFLHDNRDKYSLMSDADIKTEIDGDFYYISLSEYNGVIVTYRYVMNYSGDKKTQKLYFKEGVNTETPQTQNTTSNFSYADGIFEDSKPSQIRKISNGYYVTYMSDGTDYTIPRLVLLKGHQDSSGFTCDYPLPQE